VADRDAKNNEIATYELAHPHEAVAQLEERMVRRYPRLLLGDNNAKDLAVRLEDYPDPHGAPEFIPMSRHPRPCMKDLYNQYTAGSTSSSRSRRFAPPPGERQRHGCQGGNRR